MKDILNRIGVFLKKIYGIGVVLSLFAGGMTFIGYMVALIIGGNIAEQICVFVYKSIVPIIVYISSVIVILGLLSMYLCGERALSSNSEKG